MWGRAAGGAKGLHQNCPFSASNLCCQLLHLLRQFQRRRALLHALWTAAPRISPYHALVRQESAVLVQQALTNGGGCTSAHTGAALGWLATWAAARSLVHMTREGWI
jgi:hypothetical protein